LDEDTCRAWRLAACFEPKFASPGLAIRYSNLAAIEQDLGHLEEARHLLQRAIEIQEKAFEPDHPNTLVMKNHLAAVLVELDDG